MPGVLGLDAMWQLVGFYLRMAWKPGKGRALGVSTVKFTGEVLKNVKKATYEIDMKKIMSPGGTSVGLQMDYYMLMIKKYIQQKI